MHPPQKYKSFWTWERQVSARLGQSLFMHVLTIRDLLIERARDMYGRQAENLPLEMALDRKLTRLYGLLTPKICSPLSHHVLHGLQKRFHGMIHEDLGEFVLSNKLVLPELAVCTELRGEHISFPIHIDGLKKVKGRFCADQASENADARTELQVPT